ncbi:MAG: hypothetical protein HY093_04420 [Candidatus Liptonbacteria bacterium]|nr:hypothetical protein [Candidatus Liptonbacteria bacterium]
MLPASKNLNWGVAKTTKKVNKFRKIFLSLSLKEQRVFLAASLVLILSLVILGANLLGKSTEALPVGGGEYTEGMVGQPTFVNPVTAKTEVDKSLVALIFSRVDEVATQIDNLKDKPLIWKVRVKEGLVWPDQEKLTSDDIVFTVSKIQDEDMHSPSAPDWQGVRVERLSELEVNFTIAAPDASFLNNLKNLYILPSHIFKSIPAPNWRISDYNLSPLGGGPYKFVTYEKQANGFIKEYHLKANPNYPGETLIQTINLKFYEEKNGLLKDFNRGGVDGVGGLVAKDLEEIKRPYEALSFRLPNYYAIFMNQSKNEALKDGGVRRALEMLTPKNNLVDEIWGGRGKVQNGPIPVDAPYFYTEEKTSEKTGVQLLEAAGWTTPEATSQTQGTETPVGVRQKTINKKTFGLQFNLTVPDIPFLVQTAKKIKEAWEGAGMEVKMVTLPIEEIDGRVIKNRDYELLLYGNILSADSDLFPFWHSSQRFYPGLNFSLYSNPQVDKMLEKARQTLEYGERQQIFAKIQNLINSDNPAIFLYSPDYIYAVKTDLKGVTPSFIAEPADRFKSIGKWYLKTARVFK